MRAAPMARQAGHHLGSPVVVGLEQREVGRQQAEVGRLGVVGPRIGDSGHVGEGLGTGVGDAGLAHEVVVVDVGHPPEHAVVPPCTGPFSRTTTLAPTLRAPAALARAAAPLPTTATSNTSGPGKNDPTGTDRSPADGVTWPARRPECRAVLFGSPQASPGPLTPATARPWAVIASTLRSGPDGNHSRRGAEAEGTS